MRIKLLVILGSIFLLTACNGNKEQESTKSNETKSSKVVESSEQSLKKETNKAVIEVQK